MSEMYTPVSLWKDFSDELDVEPVILDEHIENGIKYEQVNFYGRDTGNGRVQIYGLMASKSDSPSNECLLILRDSLENADERLLEYFVNKGYNALFVDYSGEREGTERFTKYPENVAYANVIKCGNPDNVPDSAKQTCWYEWVAVGVYARKYLKERFNTEKIGIIGIRDGGEIAWKLAYVAQFSCAITVNACGWRAYKGYSKFLDADPDFDDERYRFIAGLDSQSYAPYVKCPILMLCSTGDPLFNYDRAFDTFTRINPEFALLSSISYAINCGRRIDLRANKVMFMFLDSFVKMHSVFIPKPAETKVSTDDNGNLTVKIICDNSGIVEDCGVYVAEDCIDFSTREWSTAPLKRVIDPYQREYYLNIFEKSSMVFVLSYSIYSNGFIVWSKMTTKKISGKFRNSLTKSKIMFTSNFGTECFQAADCTNHSVGDLFLFDKDTTPSIIELNGLSGVYSSCGLRTTRIQCPQFAPDKDSILKFDVCAEEDMELEVTLKLKSDQEAYRAKLYILGGVWQSQLIKPKTLKNKDGISLLSYTLCESLTVNGDKKFAINNLIWL